MPGSLPTTYLTLAQMFPGCRLEGFGNLVVGPLKLDSREVSAGDTFVALSGSLQNGRDYIQAAIKSGAKLILAEGQDFEASRVAGIPLITVPRLRQRVSQLASLWFDQPSKKMQIVGVTGTNGKTTCCQWLAQIIDGLSAPESRKVTSFAKSRSVKTKTATVGTLGFGLVGEELVETGMTTPDAVTFQSLLAAIQDAGANTVVAEVSSHSLEQNRISAVDFDVAVVTNIGRDHLDYHGSMESYVQAKTKLMGYSSLRAAVINLDDQFAQQFISAVAKDVEVISYGVHQRDADFSVVEVSYQPFGTRATLCSPQGEFDLLLPVWGEFNLCNLLAVIASAYALGYSVAQLVKNIEVIKPVCGRLEPVHVDSDITVLIDFAHTADALESVLRAVRDHIKGNIWCVFGCGGDRDVGKRPLMASVVQKLADFVVVTSDNPRTENPASIIDGIMKGFQHPGAVHRIEDRETAIRFAIEQAEPGDCVLLAGKGHEDYQLVGSKRLPFSDAAVARLALQVRPATVKRGSGKND